MKKEIKRDEAAIEAAIKRNTMPHSLDMEKYILACAIAGSRDDADTVAAIQTNIFYSEKHSLIWQAVKRLRLQSEPVDFLTVENVLKSDGNLEKVGGRAYLVKITASMVSSANLDYHIQVLTQKYAARKLITFARTMLDELHNDQLVPEIMERSDKLSAQIFDLMNFKGEKSMSDIGLEFLDDLERRIQSEGELQGIPSGISDLDRVTGGFQKDEFTIIAGRPSMGKTDLTLTIAHNAAVNFKKKVAIISMEMTENKLFARLMAIHTDLGKRPFHTGDKDILCEDGAMKKEILEATSTLVASGINLQRPGSVDIQKLKNLCASLVKKHQVDLIILDGLWLIGKGRERYNNNHEFFTELSREAKTSICGDLDIPLIAVHQLSREVEKRMDKRPIMSDLRESGSLEQDADRIIFLYRPEYYGQDVYEDGSSTAGILELIIAKNREAETGIIKVGYNPAIGRSFDLAQLPY